MRKAPATAAAHAEYPFCQPECFFGCAAQAEAFEADLLAEPTVRENHSSENDFLSIRSAGPVPGPEAHRCAALLATSRRLLVARYNQRAKDSAL